MIVTFVGLQPDPKEATLGQCLEVEMGWYRTPTLKFNPDKMELLSDKLKPDLGNVRAAMLKWGYACFGNTGWSFGGCY